MSTDTTHPKHTIPRSAGTTRPIKNIKPGWWVHLEANPDAPADILAGWEQVRWIADYTSGFRLLAFGCAADDDGNAVQVHKDDSAVTLTAREATNLGLTGEAVSA